NITTYQFENRWTPATESRPVDMNLGISGGHSFKIGEEGKLNVFGTASFENGYNLRKGNQRNIGNQNTIVIEDFYDVDKFEYSTKTTGMANVVYRINRDHKIKLNSVFINSSKSSVNEYYFTNENGSPSFTRQTIN